MNNFAQLITPEAAKQRGDSRSLEVIRALTLISDSQCWLCGREKAWRYAGLGLCFTCTTGDTDASNDCELLEYDVKALPQLNVSDIAPKGSDRWMQKQGFTWETFDENYPRWRHLKKSMSIRRMPDWTNEEWTERKIDIAERAQRTSASGRRSRRQRLRAPACTAPATFSAPAC